MSVVSGDGALITLGSWMVEGIELGGAVDMMAVVESQVVVAVDGRQGCKLEVK